MPSSPAEPSPGSEKRGPRVDALWGGPRVALAGILAGAAALRLVGVGYGLPFPLLSPDEQSIVPRAWKMVHGGGLDPHWFDYPALLMYVIAPFQAWEGEPSYLAGRLVVIALALGAIAAAWWLGESAYGGAAGPIAAAALAVATTSVAYSRMAVTDVPLTLGVAATLALLVSGRIELAGVAAGVAMGFKYPGIFLLVPLAVAGWRQPRRLAVAVVASGARLRAHEPILHRASRHGRERRVPRPTAVPARLAWLRARSRRPDRVSATACGRRSVRYCSSAASGSLSPSPGGAATT